MAASFGRPVAFSAGVHVAVVLLLIWLAGRAAPSSASRPSGPGPEGGGAREITYLTFPAFHAPTAADQTREPKRQPPPAPRVRVVDVPVATSVADVVPLASLASGLEVPTGTGPGRGGGAGGPGRGSGPGTGGSGGEVFPPQARYSILPPLPRPSSVRGKTFRVHFWVDVAGRVTRVDVSPPIPDGEYRKQFVQLMYQYTFAPALRPDGTPVAGETVLTITL
jgi:hypothetical protein